MNILFSQYFFLLANRIESLAFFLLRGMALPTWIPYALARPLTQQLPYATLLDLNTRYTVTPKPSAEASYEHQVKWANRVIHLAKIFNLHRILEIGCGHGLATQLLKQARLQVYAIDINDILTSEARQADIKFVTTDVCQGLPFASDSFDLVFAINAFEHFERPDLALDEIIRVTRSRKYIYLTYDPLYYSPWGLHASRRLGMPYPQILFSEATIQVFMDENRLELLSTFSEGSDTSKIGPPLNKYALNEYRQIFEQRKDTLKLITYTERAALAGFRLIWKYPGLFKAHATTFSDLIVGGIKLLGQKQI